VDKVIARLKNADPERFGYLATSDWYGEEVRSQLHKHLWVTGKLRSEWVKSNAPYLMEMLQSEIVELEQRQAWEYEQWCSAQREAQLQQEFHQKAVFYAAQAAQNAYLATLEPEPVDVEPEPGEMDIFMSED